ncbi:ABC transporter substrate-binding protein [Angustibacter aerolatus]
MRRLLVPLVPVAALALLATGCAPQDDDAAAPASSASASASGSATTARCSPDTMDTKTKGTLTVATDKPAYEPWFSGDDPSNGKGFESAVAFAVAKQLGFEQGSVKWVTAGFNQVISPAPKDFDVDVNQVSITDARKKNIDFSSGYYDVAQSVVTVKGSKAAGAKSIADLKGLKLGAQVGTTSYTVAKDTIAPSEQVAVFNTNDDAKAALQNGQVDALVVDLPTGLFLAAADLKNGQLVGQLPSSGTPEQFGMVLDKGSSLTACVSQAVDALRADGTLKQLEQQWLTSTAGAPELQ